MNFLWMLDEDPGTGEFGTEACALIEPIMSIVTTVIWVLVGVLGVVFVVKAVTTALAVVKAADEPQVRQEKLGSFKYLAIGLGVALAIASLSAVLLQTFGTEMITKNMNCTTGA